MSDRLLSGIGLPITRGFSNRAAYRSNPASAPAPINSNGVGETVAALCSVLTRDLAIMLSNRGAAGSFDHCWNLIGSNSPRIEGLLNRAFGGGGVDVNKAERLAESWALWDLTLPDDFRESCISSLPDPIQTGLNNPERYLAKFRATLHKLAIDEKLGVQGAVDAIRKHAPVHWAAFLRLVSKRVGSL